MEPSSVSRIGLSLSQRITKGRDGSPPSYRSNNNQFESYRAIGSGTTGAGLHCAHLVSESVSVIIRRPFPRLESAFLAIVFKPKLRVQSPGRMCGPSERFYALRMNGESDCGSEARRWD